MAHTVPRGIVVERELLVPGSLVAGAESPEAAERSPRPVTRQQPASWSTVTPAERVRTDGKFFRIGAHKFHPKGVTYGPFQPDATGSTFPTPERVAADFESIKRLHANCVRVYHIPPRWFLDLAHEHGLKVLVDYYWAKHTCFLDDPQTVTEAREVTRRAAEALKGHPAVFALTLANEIPPDIARWYGAQRIAGFIDELAGIVKAVDPDRLVTFANFPPTEFLQPASLDFISFNVYLHEPRPFANYLDRLQSVAGEKPLVLTEFGMDAQREGETGQAQLLSGHIEVAFRAGVAGTFIFAFTDDWHTGGHQIENWFFGVTDRQRQPRASYHAVAEQYRAAPYFELPAYPKVSVVVASFNGGRTLPACLDSLRHLNYPNYEMILVDDGSTDDTARIAAHYPEVRTLHQQNLGLSAARNAGIAAATGEIVAFTDSDCRADEDWLHYLVGDLLKTDACAIGGHNFPPTEDDWVAGCVAVAPGGPAHVMLDDRQAEHIPGCNMAFWKWALTEIEGFDALFRRAGDDVDVCWRLLQRGRKIAFSPAGFVWHFRRHTVQAYVKQQTGYGVAEALLRHKHPEYFNNLGGMRWRGRIYSPAGLSDLFGRFVIYHGPFGSALFQTLYAPQPAGLVALVTSPEWHILITLGLFILTSLWWALWPLPVLSLLASFIVAGVAAAKVPIPPRTRRFWSRPLVALLYLLQPIVRGWPRYASRLTMPPTPPAARQAVRSLAANYRRLGSRFTVHYWTEAGTERFAFLRRLLDLLDRDQWRARMDSGWDEFDVTVHADRFSKVVIKTVAENHGGNKRLFRGELTAQWTLLAKSLFVFVIVAVLTVLSFFARDLIYMPLLALIPLVAGYFHLRTRRTLRLGVALLDLTAQELDLVKLQEPKRFEKAG